MNAGRRIAWWLSVVFLAGCEGKGSDIGPRLTPLPGGSSKVNVLDDQNRGVVEAVVSIDGFASRATTGRNGRGDLFSTPGGRSIVVIDGSMGAAVAGDELGALRVAVSTSGGDLPTVFHLPDTKDSSSVALTVGTQASPATVTNSSAGVTLTMPSGISVGGSPGAAAVTLRVGSLAPEHLPGDLPSGSTLFGRGAYIDPPEASFTPGADLSVPDDLASGGTATLYRLDADTGEWVTVGSGIASGGFLVASGGVSTGGLYAFGIAVPTGSVRGRIVDADGSSIAGAIVHVDQRRALSDGGGSFLVDGVAAELGDGSPRSAVVEAFAPGGMLPSVARQMAAMNGATLVDLGDLTLDTTACCNIRIQQVLRSRAVALRPARLSSMFQGVALATTSDSRGQAMFEDVPIRTFGFQDAFPRDEVFTSYAQISGFVEPGRRWLDIFQFYDKLAWFTGSRTSRVLATDAVGGGLVFGAKLIRGSSPGAGFFFSTREGGDPFVARAIDGRVTGTLRSERDGKVIVHAFTIDTPNGQHIELPLRQALRRPLGAFDRHGIVSGTIVGADPTKQHELRVTRRIELDDWWAQTFEGAPILSSLPIDVDPAVTHGAYRCGVDAAGGNLVAVELDGVTATTKHLLGMGVLADVEPIEGREMFRDIPLDHAATAPFVAAGALAENAGFAGAELSLDLALEQPSGRVIDVVQGLTGNHSLAGSDVTLTLPPLDGSLAGHAWLASLGGSKPIGSGGVIAQRCMLRFDGSAPPAGAFLAVPSITSPADGATVSSGGFTVQLALPPAAQYATIELRSETTGELLLWNVYLPPGSTEFEFVTLPAESETPLVAGKTYRLTLSAYAASGGPLANNEEPYRVLSSFVQSIGPAERGVVAVSSHTLTVTSN